MCVGGGNVWKWQRKETKDKKEEIRHSSVLQYHIPCVHYAIISWNINRTPTSQTICTELHRCFLPDAIQKLSAGRRQAFSDSDRPVGWWCGRAWPRRKESWQQEGEESHKVATQSSRLACLSRVNISPRLHTVMTNRGGRAQKYYQDYCLVLLDPTHAIPIISQPLHSENKQSATSIIKGAACLFTFALVWLRKHGHALWAAHLTHRKDR